MKVKYLRWGNVEDKTEKGYKNLTLRLTDEYHRQLASQAARAGQTLNGHIASVIKLHLMNSGYTPDSIKSSSGRLFEVQVEPIRQRTLENYYSSRFDIYEYHPLYTKRRAHYIFGLDQDLVAKHAEPFSVVKDVGLGLLNLYNRQGFELDQIAWKALPNHPSTPSPTMEDNWRYVGVDTTEDVERFLIKLLKDEWRDELIWKTGQSQDIRCKLRTEADLYR